MIFFIFRLPRRAFDAYSGTQSTQVKYCERAGSHELRCECGLAFGDRFARTIEVPPVMLTVTKDQPTRHAGAASQRASMTRCRVSITVCAALLMAQASAQPASEARYWDQPRNVARAFVQGCLQTEGQPPAAVDWALSQGFEPLDPSRGNADELLSGLPGSVLVAPDSQGRVLLAVAEGQRCTLWVDKAVGPSLKLAMATVLAEHTAKGAKLSIEVDRAVENAGAWRNHLQWRYRAFGARSDFSIVAVTTLLPAPATQAINLSPARPLGPAYSPDGQPLR
jgi:hypothetical protein